MKERPILFSTPMVRALLAGTKTQTRRVVKATAGRPVEFLGCGPVGGPDWNNPECWGYMCHDDAIDVLLKPDGTDPSSRQYPCPYGKPGDRLWVRETWAHARHAAAANCVEDGPFVYAADGEFAARERLNPRWVPGIHMFRWASRITLEVVSVRVERLQAISQADAIAEGIEKTAHDFWSTYGQLSVDGTYSPSVSYHALWQSINGAEGPTSWTANPWVWVVEFKTVKP